MTLHPIEDLRSTVVAAAAEKSRGNPDDHMHALDYLVYGYLQMAQDAEAKKANAEYIQKAMQFQMWQELTKAELARPTQREAAFEPRWGVAM